MFVCLNFCPYWAHFLGYHNRSLVILHFFNFRSVFPNVYEKTLLETKFKAIIKYKLTCFVQEGIFLVILQNFSLCKFN